MSGDARRGIETAVSLRQAFDRVFAEPPAQAPAAFEDLLAVRIGHDRFAIRLQEAAGLYADRKIVPIPSSVAELLGIVSLRGQLTPIYDLGRLLGYPARAAPRWFVLARGPIAIGLAFEGFEAHARVPRASFAAGETDAPTHEHVRGAVRVQGVVRPIVHIASVLEAITTRVRAVVPRKERSLHG